MENDRLLKLIRNTLNNTTDQITMRQKFVMIL